MTGVGAVINTAKPSPGESVAVFGAGGAGISVIQSAVLSGAYPIIAVDNRAERLEGALKFGATHTVNAAEDDPVDAIKELTLIRADYTFEANGNVDVMRQAWDATAKGGTEVVIGGAGMGDEVSLPALDFPFTEKVIRGTGYGGARMSVDIPRSLDLFMAGRLKLDDMVTSTYRLEGVNDAFGDLRAGKNLRGVLIM